MAFKPVDLMNWVLRPASSLSSNTFTALAIMYDVLVYIKL